MRLTKEFKYLLLKIVYEKKYTHNVFTLHFFVVVYYIVEVFQSGIFQ